GGTVVKPLSLPRCSARYTGGTSRRQTCPSCLALPGGGAHIPRGDGSSAVPSYALDHPGGRLALYRLAPVADGYTDRLSVSHAEPGTVLPYLGLARAAERARQHFAVSHCRCPLATRSSA